VLGEDWGGTASTHGETPTSSASEVKKTGRLPLFMKLSAPIEYHEKRRFTGIPIQQDFKITAFRSFGFINTTKYDFHDEFLMQLC
jgi:hypothetical protein